MKSYERFISREEIEKIHEYSLKILSEIGMRFEHEGALEVFRKHGARVEGQTVFIDEKMVTEALRHAQRSFTVKSCKGDLEIGSGKQYNGAIGGNVYCHYPDGAIRKMSNEDTLNQFKLEDTSDILDFGTINYFQDYSKGFTLDQKIFSNIALILKYGHKPLFLTTANTFALSDKKAIKEAFEKSVQLLNDFEGNDAVHNVYILNTLSPLTMDHDPLERVFVLCEANQGIMFAPCAMPLMTAPPSIASMVAMTNAEVLGGYVLAKLLNPNVPVVYGNTSGATDMRTVQLAIGAPECALVVYATAGLADYYGLPFRTGGSLSDAKDADIQAGAESMMMITATQDVDADIVLHACGCMGSFNVTDFRKFLIDEEIQRMNQRLFAGIDCSDEKFCMDTLKKVGPRGAFLTGRTPKMYREEVYLARYFNKDDPNQWQNKGSISVVDVAQQDVEKRLASYTVPEITKEQNDLLQPYLPDAYKEMI